MWLLGGHGMTGGGDVWYSTDGVTWTRGGSMPGQRARGGHTSVVYAGKMWIMGGGQSLPRNDVWYSTNGTTWTQATAHAAWSPRRSHASVVYDGKIWLIGGTDGNNALDDVWYSRNGTSWSLATARGPWTAGVLNHAFVVFDGKMWVIAGNPYYNAAYSSNGLNWTVATNGWGPWLGKMGGMGVVASAGKLWLMGGLQLPPAWDEYANDVWSSTDGVSWRLVSPQGYAPWWPRQLFAPVVFDRRMWILGGATSSGALFNDVWYSQFPAETTPAWKLYR
jgi:hypothetical protein